MDHRINGCYLKENVMRHKLCFTTRFKHKRTYFMRTIPNISNQLKQLDGIVRTALIKATSGDINFQAA